MSKCPSKTKLACREEVGHIKVTCPPEKPIYKKHSTSFERQSIKLIFETQRRKKKSKF